MKNKNKSVFLILIIFVLIFFLYTLMTEYFKQQEKIEYVEQWNEYLINRMGEDNERSMKMSAVEKIKKDEKFERFAEIVASRSIDIEFFGKIVDQAGEPVKDAIVEFDGASGYLARGSGSGEVKTDTNGLFHILNTKGVSLIIKNMHKEGYEIKMEHGGTQMIFDSHQRFPESELFQNYASNTTPYIFKAWKLSQTKNRLINSGRNFNFLIDREYWIDFTLAKIRKNSNKSPDSLMIIFSRNGDVINLSLNMINGGLVETERKHYMNVAPDAGYQTEYSYNFDATARTSLSSTKYFFFRTGEKRLYGKVMMDISPNFQKKKAYISFRYQTNLDGTTSLEN